EKSHSQHTNSDEITQLDTTNQPKIHLTKSKSRAASYLARKTSNPGKSEKNLPLVPNVSNIVTNNVTLQSKNKTILSPIQKGNNNTLKKKKAKPPLEKKPKQEFSKENIKQNESTKKWVDKQYNLRKCKRFITHLLPESFSKQVKKLRELVKENENKVKLIGVTTNTHWDEIVLPSKKGKKKDDELSKDQPRKINQIIKQKLNRLDKAILDREIAKDTKIKQTIQDLNWRLEQINKTYSYTQGLTKEEIEEYLESIQKITKIKDTDKPAETRREYLYEKHREDIKDLQEEYNKDIHRILDITAEEFNDIGLIEQQAAVTALITAQAHCKDESTKQALYKKHKEFLESQLEKVGEMYDDKEIQGRIYRDVIKARKKEKPQMLLPDPKGRNTYKLYEQYDVLKDKEFVRENDQIGIRISHSPTDDIFLNERLSQASRRNEDIPQGVLPKVTKFFKDIGQGIKNKFTSRPTTSSPLSQHTLSRTPTIEISADALD
ncbi:11251_t:CDS:2, partial [Dentiscutata erythropus]